MPRLRKAYIGQTDWNLKTRFNENKRSFQSNSLASKYAQHLIEHLHTFGNMHIIQIIQFQKKGIHLNAVERFHIHKEGAANNHFNDDYTVSANKIFNNILKNLLK
jgi:hypothetical protein